MNAKSAAAILIFVSLALSLFGLDIPDAIDFGIVQEGETVRRNISISGDRTGDFELELLSPCPCITVDPNLVRVAPGTDAGFAIEFDSTGYEGEIEKIVLVRITGKAERYELIELRGYVDASGGPILDEAVCPKCEETLYEERIAALRDGPSGIVINVELFSTPGCNACDRIAEQYLPAVEREVFIRFDLERIDILDDDGFRYMDERLGSLATELDELPLLIIGNAVLQGEEAITADLLAATRAEKKRKISDDFANR